MLVANTLGLLLPATAAPVTWGDVFVVDHSSDINKPAGATLLLAADFNTPAGAAAGGDGIINGIPFETVDQNVPGLLTTNIANGPFYDATLVSAVTDDADLDALLDSHSYISGNPGTAIVTLEGLQPGATYQVQLIAVADDRDCCAGRRYQTDDGQGVYGTGTKVMQRGLHQSVIGILTANGTSQPLQVRSLNNWAGENDPGLSGLVIHKLASATPPSTYEPLAGFELGPQMVTSGVQYFRETDNAGLFRHTDGNMYGATYFGGAYNKGTLYRVTPAGRIDNLLSFGGSASGAADLPDRNVVVDGFGVIWGIVNNELGGLKLFRYDPNPGAFQLLVAPLSNPSPLIRDGQGFIWGADHGRVFKVDELTSAFVEMASFTGNVDMEPKGRPAIAGPLYDDGTGILRGISTLNYGAPFNNYCVFEVSKATGHVRTLASTTGFTTLACTGLCGGIPGQNELLTTFRPPSGTSFWSRGGIIRIDSVTGHELSTVDFTGFDGNYPGNHPTAPTVFSNGRLWGSTEFGGIADKANPDGRGTIFRLNGTTGALESVVQFSGTNGSAPGSHPVGALTADAANPALAEHLWGTTEEGGRDNLGTVFKVNTVSGGTVSFTSVASFTGIDGPYGGKAPWTELTSDGLGNLWGTTTLGGANNFGILYKMNEATRAITTVVDFTGTTGLAKGATSWAGLYRDAAGLLWGVTADGGASDMGTVFKVDPVSGGFSTVIEFTGTSGANPGESPIGALTGDGEGNLWGTTFVGGANGFGTVFKFNPASGLMTQVVTFTGNGGAASGNGPQARLLNDGHGYLWGTTRTGGTGSGTIFKINITTGLFTNILNFAGANGAEPTSALVSGGADNLWGTSYTGGASNKGTIFKINRSTGLLTTMKHLPAALGDGSYLRCGLTRDVTGNFWGITRELNGLGTPSTIFKITPAGVFTTMFSLTGIDGSLPGGSSGFGSLLLHTDGNLYGTTIDGGRTSDGRPAGGGQIFRIRIDQPFDIATATPRMTVQAGGAVEVYLAGTSGGQFLLQRSVNLSNWTDLQTLTAAEDGSVMWADPAPPVGRVFYRVRQL